MKKYVFMDHDGAIDDLLSQMLLLTMPEVEVIGISITPADCFIEPALESAYKLLQLLGREEVPLGRGEYHGINAFPGEWRARPGIVNALPMLLNLPPAPDPYDHPTAVELMVRQIGQAPGPVTVLLTGPCSNLVLALEQEPALQGKIAEVVWMAGAFRVPGNVHTFQHDSTAEWNVYWDPVSTRKLFALRLPLTLIPLDVTNQVPVHKSFLARLAGQLQHPLSHLAGQLWALTTDTIPGYAYTYFMWDILATSYLALPGSFTTEEVKAQVGVRPPNAGQTYEVAEGHPLRIATAVDEEAFLKYLLEQFRR